MVRQQGRCGQTGLSGLLQATGMPRASISHVNISSTRLTSFEFRIFRRSWPSKPPRGRRAWIAGRIQPNSGSTAKMSPEINCAGLATPGTGWTSPRPRGRRAWSAGRIRPVSGTKAKIRLELKFARIATTRTTTRRRRRRAQMRSESSRRRFPRNFHFFDLREYRHNPS